MPALPQTPVSVMIVTHDRPRFLRRCLEELRTQRGVALEVVIVDDASETDLTLVTRDFEGVFPIRFVRLPARSGAAAARNVGFRACTHDVVVQLDDDSRMVEPDAALGTAQYLLEHPDIGALALRIFNPWDGASDGVGEVYPRWNEPHLTEEYSFHGCGVVFRRDAVVRVGGYADEFVYGAPEDFLGLRLMAAGYRIVLHGAYRVVHGDDAMTPLEPSDIPLRDKRIFHIAHLVATSWVLFPFPWNVLSSAGRFLQSAARDVRHAAAAAPRIVHLLRTMPREPMSWSRLARYSRVRRGSVKARRRARAGF